MKYIPADKLIAEIERYKQGAAIARFDNAGENADYFQGKVDLCDDLTHIITSLPQEQPEVELEKFDKDVTEIWGRCAAEPNDSIACFHIETFNEVARHFYELGKNAGREE